MSKGPSTGKGCVNQMNLNSHPSRLKDLGFRCPFLGYINIISRGKRTEVQNKTKVNFTSTLFLYKDDEKNEDKLPLDSLNFRVRPCEHLTSTSPNHTSSQISISTPPPSSSLSSFRPHRERHTPFSLTVGPLLTYPLPLHVRFLPPWSTLCRHYQDTETLTPTFYGKWTLISSNQSRNCITLTL